MKSNFLAAFALTQLASAVPSLRERQNFDLDAILNAPSPSATGPPMTAVANVSSTSFYSVNTASLAASVSSDVTGQATASVTGVAASAAGTTTISSSSACPTTPEAGTYCGFINPEDACAPQPSGYGPQVQPDTPAAFEAYPAFSQDALSAVTPQGYVNVFKNLNASVNANSYLTYETLTSYDVEGCAAFCDNTALCTAFNIYIERDPSVNPTTNGTNVGWGSNCPNPPSITNYKCSLWGSSIDAASATNYGQYRDEFEVVIAGSNGYDKTNTTTPPSIPGWGPPGNCSGGAISSGGNYWMGSKFYPGPFDPSLCTLYGQAQTGKNKQIAEQQGANSYVPCNMINAYMVFMNGVAQGTYCQLFDTVLDSSWAAFQGVWSGENYFSVQSSWTYALSELDDGKL
ncbi:hypothetical protein M433DRAFT_102178 [Acidomyces richmondensis BFW]|nr:MAG: hypothetical protein FE78DRAFT_175689 [Acidomyces sp. 'richmondensis']KYG48700.1 hypothetical protein M433DRAFT_102178 [Acidomyces richmondensis BFW]